MNSWRQAKMIRIHKTPPHLISVDELRAAGALDVPEAWRKSLAPESRYTLPGFGDDEEDMDSDVAECSEPVEEHLRTDQAHVRASTSSPQRKSALNSHQPRATK